MHAKIEPTSRRQSNARTREHVASAHNKNNRQQQIADSNNKHNNHHTTTASMKYGDGKAQATTSTSQWRLPAPTHQVTQVVVKHRRKHAGRDGAALAADGRAERQAKVEAACDGLQREVLASGRPDSNTRRSKW
jgi:hypothetical protein